MQDEVRSMKLRVRRVKSEENVADLGTKPLSRAVIANHCLTLGYVNMAEENGWCKVQYVAVFRSFGPIQMIVTGAENTAGDHAKKSVHREPAAATAATDAAAASGRRAGDWVCRETSWQHRIPTKQNRTYFEMSSDIIENDIHKNLRPVWEVPAACNP